MEYGLIPKIDQAAQNYQLLVQQVQPSNEIAKLKEQNEAKEIVKENFLKPKEKEEVSESSTTIKAVPYQEVVLTNLNFGFNNSSKDFYVKAIRGEAENQYPTDEMMRLKAYFIAQAKAEAAKEAM
ncbi:hypothetical protein [Halarcobacter bivalviorum]|uniref:FlaG family protein n=1 Tax=Halarcobacter bivalviorum TaxID=663364 RepID=A0AAX2AD06_9BACT|nr:hypothetical protein [Halarcobacter bivalviorum]AXH12526.1 FlaG family protein [Halarcobacter bivalviorum]RXK10551.1 hypothetical protein CRV05_04535 [Halarcobacter bivalviorum]